MSKKIGLLIVILVLVGGGLVLFKDRDSGQIGGAATGEEKRYTDPQDGEIAVEGKLGCLPLKSGETPEGDTCIVGLVGGDGKFYALDTSKVEIIEKGIDIDTTVRLVGKYTKADTGNEEAGIFRYDGVLAVRVMQNQSN
jgi:hypothetical protein